MDFFQAIPTGEETLLVLMTGAVFSLVENVVFLGSRQRLSGRTRNVADESAVLFSAGTSGSGSWGLQAFEDLFQDPAIAYAGLNRI